MMVYRNFYLYAEASKKIRIIFEWTLFEIYLIRKASLSLF